jgi:uncharacterized Zn-finger protein
MTGYACHSVGQTYDLKVDQSHLFPFLSLQFMTHQHIQWATTLQSSIGKKLKCDICGAVSMSQSNFAIHMRTHSGERPFKCDICPSMFASKGNLKIHLRVHSGEKPYCCTICGRNFARPYTLKGHLVTHLKKPV